MCLLNSCRIVLVRGGEVIGEGGLERGGAREEKDVGVWILYL